MKTLLLIVLCAASLSLASTPNTAHALAFRCDSNLIDVGMHKIEVLKKCGNPAMRDQRVERRRSGMRQSNSQQDASSRQPNKQRLTSQYEQEMEIHVEEWIYNFGPQRFMQLLTFENGQLTKIQDLERGQ